MVYVLSVAAAGTRGEFGVDSVRLTADLSTGSVRNLHMLQLSLISNSSPASCFTLQVAELPHHETATE